MARTIGRGVPDDIGERRAIAGTAASDARALPGVADGGLDPFASRECYSPKRIKRINLALDAVRVSVEFQFPGTLVWCPDSSDVTAICGIQFDTLDNDQIPYSNGTVLSGVPFRTLYISNSSQPGESLTLIVIDDCPGDRVDAR